MTSCLFRSLRTIIGDMPIIVEWASFACRCIIQEHGFMDPILKILPSLPIAICFGQICFISDLIAIKAWEQIFSIEILFHSPTSVIFYIIGRFGGIKSKSTM